MRCIEKYTWHLYLWYYNRLKNLSVVSCLRVASGGAISSRHHPRPPLAERPTLRWRHPGRWRHQHGDSVVGGPGGGACDHGRNQRQAAVCANSDGAWWGFWGHLRRPRKSWRWRRWRRCWNRKRSDAAAAIHAFHLPQPNADQSAVLTQSRHSKTQRMQDTLAKGLHAAEVLKARVVYSPAGWLKKVSSSRIVK